MVETKNVFIGVIAIILGILVMVFPLIGVFTASIIDGAFCLLISIWIIMHSIQGWKINKTSSLVFLVWGIIGFIIGLLIIGNINLYSFFFGITFYLAGLILLIAGLLFIFMGEDRNTKFNWTPRDNYRSNIHYSRLLFHESIFCGADNRILPNHLWNIQNPKMRARIFQHC